MPKLNPQASRRVRATLTRDPVMARLIAAAGPFALETRQQRPPFESLTRAIAHQQLNGTAAQRILERFCALYAPTPFPQPQALLDTPESSLRGAGFSFAKIRALRDLAKKSASGIVPETPELLRLDDDAIVERLTQVRGIGRWTVEMLLMFQLGRPDVLPVDDFGVRNGFRLAYGLRHMPTPRGLLAFGERWRPWRSAAAWYLWRAVDLAREQKLPVPLKPPPRVPVQKPRAVAPVKAMKKTLRKVARLRRKLQRVTKKVAPRRARR